VNRTCEVRFSSLKCYGTVPFLSTPVKFFGSAVHRISSLGSRGGARNGRILDLNPSGWNEILGPVMGRLRTIDRDMVPDAAEEIVQRDGGSALTLDAVAKAAGITKGGVQYCFDTKDDLIVALIKRWMTAFAIEITKNSPPNSDFVQRTMAYITASKGIDEATRAKMVGMLVTLLQSPRYRPQIRSWYTDWFGKFQLNSEAERRALRRRGRLHRNPHARLMKARD
jgi:AcrR family transcriptional regulator